MKLVWTDGALMSLNLVRTSFVDGMTPVQCRVYKFSAVAVGIASTLLLQA